jgi:hypothetical protein
MRSLFERKSNKRNPIEIYNYKVRTKAPVSSQNYEEGVIIGKKKPLLHIMMKNAKLRLII